MKRLVSLMLLIGPTAWAETAADLSELIARIEKTANPGNGMNQAEQELARQLAPHRTAAADLLLPFLKSGDKEIRQLAAYCILELPPGSLMKRHLPDLMAACRKERNWLPGAIAAIGSEDALRFLAEDFRRHPQTGAQIDHALIRTAPRSIPHLLREFREAAKDETDFFDELQSVLMAMEDKAKDAVAPLHAIALDDDEPVFRRKRAIGCLGSIGPPAKDIFPMLEASAEDQPEWFAAAVDDAIMKSRTGGAAAGLLRRALAQALHEGELYGFRDLAELGEEAGIIGDQLVGLLDDKDPNVRLGACRTLGYTNRLDLWPHLTRALKDRDWRVSFSACLGLARWQAKGSLPSLEWLAENHWYPRVRHTAKYAIQRIHGTTPTDEQELQIVSPIDSPDTIRSFFAFGFGGNMEGASLDEAAMAKLRIERPSVKPIVWDVPGDDSAELETFRTLYPELHSAICEADPKGKTGQWGNLCRLTGMLEQDGTTLVAFSAGEWVGGLLSIPAKGEASLLLNENIYQLLDWNGTLVTLSGIYHMGMVDGTVHEIAQENGRWVAKFLHALPGCPWNGGLLPDGRLFANCSDGAVAIGKDGRFEYLSGDRSPPTE